MLGGRSRDRGERKRTGVLCAGGCAKTKEADVLVDFGKKVLLGLIAAACLVGAHAAAVYSVVG